MPRMKTLMITICLVVSCSACDLNERKMGKICCPLCPPGWFFVKNCTESNNTKCLRCPVGTFQGGHTDKKQCYNCTECDAGLGLKEKRSCSSRSDALCEPLDGFFCSDSNGGGCRAAQRHTVSSPGQHIGQRGTADNHTECLHCTDGTFLNGTSSACQNHTKCESVGLELKKPGTNSTNSECGEHGSHKGQVAGGLTVGVILVLVMALIIAAIIQREKIRVWINRRQKKRKTQEQEMELSESSPLKSSDCPAPTGDQQQPTTTTPAATMDDHDGDQSLALSPPSCPTHNGSVSVTVHQEEAAIVSPSSDNCTINVGDPPVIFKGEIGAA